jgi:hypothetical protein
MVRGFRHAPPGPAGAPAAPVLAGGCALRGLWPGWNAAAYTGHVGTIPAEGWYRDPFAIHEDRWMSQGQPTKLVRDGGTESYDPPPDLPLPAELVPVESGSGEADVGSGAHGRGEAGQDSGYSDWRARRAAFDAVTGGAAVDEPGGEW